MIHSIAVSLADEEPAPAAVARFFEKLDSRFRAPLMAYFLRRVKDRAEAEDLTQEVFVHLIAQAKSLLVESADAYIFTIAANLLRDRGRRAVSRRVDAHQSLDDPQHPLVDVKLFEEIGPERVLIGKENLRAVMDALGELSERTRNIFMLFRLEKMRQREIAALYGLSVKAVERYVAQASAHLAARLKLHLVKEP